MTAQQQKAATAAAEFNRICPPGSPVLAWPGTRDEEPLRTRTRHSAWVLSSGEAVVNVIGHAGGIALTHVDPDPTRQPAVPDVEFEMPPCPICSGPVDSDGDALVCHRCHASWSGNGTNGTWHDPASRRCRATARPYVTIETEEVAFCILHRGHDLEGEEYSETHHSDDFTSWTDADSRALTDSDGEEP